MKMTRIAALLTALAVALCAVPALAEDAAVPIILEAADTFEGQPVGTAEVPAAEAFVAPDAATVLAVVNGTEVTYGDVEPVLDNIVSYYGQMGYDMTLPDNAEVAREMAFETTIQNVIVRQKAAEWGLDVLSAEDEETLKTENDTMWEDAIDDYILYMANLPENASEEDRAAARVAAIAYFEAAGFTTEGTLQEAREQLIYERVVAKATEGAAVTEEEVAARYEELVEEDKAQYEGQVFMYEYFTMYYGQPSYYTPAGYRAVLRIVLPVDDELLQTYLTLSAQYEEQAQATETGTATASDAPAVTAEEVEAARTAVIASVQPTVDEIMGKFNAGTPFAELMDEYSVDEDLKAEPARSAGYSVHLDSIVWDPAFIQGAFSVDQIGEVSAPVAGTDGVYLVYYMADVPEGGVELTEELRNGLYETMLGEKEEALFEAEMTRWMDEADIVYTDAAADFLPAEVEETETDGDAEAPAGTAEAPAEVTDETAEPAEASEGN